MTSWDYCWNEEITFEQMSGNYPIKYDIISDTEFELQFQIKVVSAADNVYYGMETLFEIGTQSPVGLAIGLPINTTSNSEECEFYDIVFFTKSPDIFVIDDYISPPQGIRIQHAITRNKWYQIYVKKLMTVKTVEIYIDNKYMSFQHNMSTDLYQFNQKLEFESIRFSGSVRNMYFNSVGWYKSI
eukprot:57051_1